MMLRACSFENEVLQALRNGHWPHGCAAELCAHVVKCSACSDLVSVTQTFQSARNESTREAALDSPGLLWWRAQLRRRHAANEQVNRPITIAQRFALVMTLAAAVVFVASQYRRGLHWASWWAELAPTRLFHLLSSSPTPQWNFPLLIAGLAGLALLSGLVVYLVTEKS
ncbi:MAG TPA: hypothetical protein VMH04_22925 [Candidatus Solibacter sp.]|nr:hypothetical protein [Candidatus Solibacter sp.]